MTALNFSKTEQQSALLAMMGLSSYVTKVTATTILPIYQDRMGQKYTAPNKTALKNDGLNTHSNTAQDGSDEQDAITLNSLPNSPISQAQSNVQPQSQSQAQFQSHPSSASPIDNDTKSLSNQINFNRLPSELPTGGRVVVTSETLSWRGFAYQGFVLLADNRFLTTATKGVWQSLTERLSMQGGRGYELDFPMGDFDDYVQMAALGFLSKLSLTAKKFLKAQTPNDEGQINIRYLLLTPFDDGVDFEIDIIPCPSLDDMARYKQAKLDFWTLLHQAQ